MRSRLTHSTRDKVLCAIVSTVLGVVFLMSQSLGGWLSRKSFDLGSRLRRPFNPGQVVIVNMDEASFRDLGQDPTAHWNRDLHAQLLDRITRWGANVVVFDIAFTAPLEGGGADGRFSDALARNGKTVLATSVTAVTLQNEVAIEEPILATEQIRTNAYWGSANWHLESDEVCRRFPNMGTSRLLSVQAAMLWGLKPFKVPFRPYLRFYGGPGTLDHVSYRDVLRSDFVSSEVFSNKTVFVGAGHLMAPARAEFQDEHQTPMGRMSGTEIQATAFLNLIRNEWLTELSPPRELAVFVIVGLVTGLAFGCLKPWHNIPAVMLAGAGFALIGVFLPVLHRVWFPWLIPVVVQIPAAAVCSLVLRSRRMFHENLELARQKKALQAKIKSTSDRELRQTPGHDRASSNPTSSLGGPVIPGYALHKVIGRGAYGEVWLAESVIGMFQAVKVLYRSKFEVSEPYEREFRAVELYMPISHTHPGLVSLFHVGREDANGYFYYVMDIGDDVLHGQSIDPATYTPRTLARDAKSGEKLPLIECVNLGIHLADALDHLHQQKLVHRDIKPSNVIFVKGAPRFADVGLVTDMASKADEVSAVGTPAYMAPEGPGTAVADVYSLGKLLYVVGMGRRVQDFPELPSAVVASQDSFGLSRLNQIILKAAAPRDRDRFQSAADLSQALKNLRDELKRL